MALVAAMAVLGAVVVVLLLILLIPRLKLLLKLLRPVILVANTSAFACQSLFRQWSSRSLYFPTGVQSSC